MTAPSNTAVEKWKTECQHVWMARRLRAPTCAKCGASKVFSETKEHRDSLEIWSRRA